MAKFKKLQEKYINGDLTYDFGGFIPPVLFPDPTPPPSPSQTPTNTPTPTQTPTNSPTPTQTPTNTPTNTQTPTPTPTNTQTPTNTPTNTQTPTPTQTNTPTPSPVVPGYLEADLYLNAVVDAGGVGITSPISAATRTMFNQLFTNNLWDKLDFFYPLLGQVANAHKFNGKLPLDTNAAFRLSFLGGWTHSSTGITANGINSYAMTHYVPSSAGTISDSSVSLGVYHYDTGTTISYPSEIGIEYFNQGLTLNVGQLSAVNNVGKMYGALSITGYASSAQTGDLIVSRTGATTRKVYRRGVLVNTDSLSSGTRSNLDEDIVVGASRSINNSNIANYSDRTLSFIFAGQGLDDTEVGNLSSIINDYQIALGRSAY